MDTSVGTVQLTPAGEKSLAWVHGEIKTPPFSAAARIEAGLLLRRLQRGERLGLPHSRPMPGIGPQVHELRIRDESKTWRIIYHLGGEDIAILEVFAKKTRRTPIQILRTCRRRLESSQGI